MKKLFVLLLEMSLFAFSLEAQKTIEKENKAFNCLIQGEVIGRPESSRLILIKPDENPRLTGIRIPIREGKFKYSLECADCEAYNLIFEEEERRGSFIPFLFFTGREGAKITLHKREESDKNIITGNKENKKYLEFRKLGDELFPRSEFDKQREILINEGKYYNEKERKLSQEMDAVQDNRQKFDSLYTIYRHLCVTDSIYTPEGLALEKEYSKLLEKQQEWKMEYYRTYPSVATYYLLKTDFSKYQQSLRYEDSPRHRAVYYMDTDKVLQLLDSVYRPLFPYHPYTLQMDACFTAIRRVQEGEHFIDFTASGLFDDIPVTLSEKIAGKVALIELWASWCGPCRKKAMAIIPVYEKYKDRGFTVVGITQERNKQDGVNAAQKDKYPWLNLLELNNKGKIWEKYGVGDISGSSFLIDRDGTILRINPTAEEVMQILENKLK